VLFRSSHTCGFNRYARFEEITVNICSAFPVYQPALSCFMMYLPHLLSVAMLTYNNTQQARTDSCLSFDPINPTYQVSSKYAPDKLSTWNYGIELDGWMMAHDALRGEVNDFDKALETLLTTTNLNTSQARAVQQWWSLHRTHMESHHRNEDKIVKKFACRRFKYPEFMEKDHLKIEAHLRAIDTQVGELIGNFSSVPTVNDDTSQSILSKLSVSWKAYKADLFPHLKAEEDICIPLMRAYFTMSRVHHMAHKLARTGPRVETGAIVHYAGKDRVFDIMKTQQVPVLLRKVAWALILRPRYQYYKTHMLGMLKILSQGETLEASHGTVQPKI